jgi:hypothetical protein
VRASAKFFAAAAAAGQLAVPLQPPPVSIDAGVQHILRGAFLSSVRLLSELTPAPAARVEQTPFTLKFRPLFRNKRTGRPCKYPFEIIQDARVMRDNGFEYKEISAALSELYKDQLRKIGVERIPWITCRDWSAHYYRLRG